MVGAAGGISPQNNASLYGWGNNVQNSTSRLQTFAISSPCQTQMTSRPDYSQRTVIPYDRFNVKDDTMRIAAAVKSGDKDTLIDIICQRSYEQRKQIADLYEEMYGKRLVQSIKKDISENSYFSILIRGLTIPFTEYLARAIHNTQYFRWVCYIMITLPGNDLEAVRSHFETSNIVF